MRRSAPASRRCVAYECLSVWGLTRRSMPAVLAAKRTASQMHFGRQRLVGAPAVLLSREEVRLRPHPPVVLAQRREQRRAQGHLAPVAALPALDADHHALAVDVRDFQLQQLAAAQARAVERHQHRAVIEILRARNELAHFVGTQDRGQPPMALRGGQLLLQLAALEHPHKEEAQGGDVESHGPDGELLLSK